LRRRGGSIGRRCTLTAGSAATATHVLLHGFELLLLLIVQHRFNLALRILTEGLHAGPTISLRDGLILEESLHLLVAIDQEGLDLALLIRGERKFFAHVLQLTIGVHATRAARTALRLTLIGGGWGSVLRKGRAGDAECEEAAEREGD
jgi:hypothetical protein